MKTPNLDHLRELANKARKVSDLASLDLYSRDACTKGAIPNEFLEHIDELSDIIDDIRDFCMTGGM